MRDLFKETRILSRIADDIDTMFDISDIDFQTIEDLDSESAIPGGLWDPDKGHMKGRVNYGDE